MAAPRRHITTSKYLRGGARGGAGRPPAITSVRDGSQDRDHWYFISGKVIIHSWDEEQILLRDKISELARQLGLDPITNMTVEDMSGPTANQRVK